MQLVSFLDGKPITLNFKEFEDEVDVDSLCVIDHSNLFGEAITAPALLNHIGLLCAESEKSLSLKKMELDYYESDLRQRLRKEAVETSQKITEAGLNEMVEVDNGYKIKKKNVITAQYHSSIVDYLYKSISSKNKKLDVMIYGISPKELYQELQEGVINNILIKKHKSITEK